MKTYRVVPAALNCAVYMDLAVGGRHMGYFQQSLLQLRLLLYQCLLVHSYLRELTLHLFYALCPGRAAGIVLLEFLRFMPQVKVFRTQVAHLAARVLS
eukprot:COSAG02_NODE_18698_length_924_cov_1.168485_1_plen_97_part_10